MSTSRGWRVFALGTLIAFSGCVRNPVSGWPEVTFMSTEGEVELGRQASERVEIEMGLVETRRLDAYVKSLGQVEFLFALVISTLFFRERTTRFELLGMLLVAMGVVVLLLAA